MCHTHQYIRAASYPVAPAVARHQEGITALKWMIKLSFAASVSTVNYLVYYFSCRGKMKKLCIFLYLGHREDGEGAWGR